MNIHFYAWYDNYSKMNIIAFGTEENILNDCLTSEDLDWNEISDLKDFFNDTGELCEDYLISTDISLNEIDSELISRGFIKDERLENVGWG
jgi:hypothetical protein